MTMQQFVERGCAHIPNSYPVLVESEQRKVLRSIPCGTSNIGCGGRAVVEIHPSICRRGVLPIELREFTAKPANAPHVHAMSMRLLRCDQSMRSSIHRE